MMRRRFLPLLAAFAALLLAAISPAWAQQGPYDETADARQQIQQALVDASRDQRPLLLVFGANWCGDCKVLEMAFKEGRVATLVSQRYRVLKINVGRFDRNTDLAERYGVPLKEGIPAVALVSAAGQTVYATKAGELADARKMGEQGIHDFFAKLAAPSR